MTLKRGLILFFIACAVVLAIDLVDIIGVWTENESLQFKHAHYGAERWFGFYGLYGFVGCVLLVLAAKVLRKIVMRSEDYYDR